MSSQISQPKPWRPPVVIIDPDSQNGDSRRGVKPTIELPPHGGENAQPIIIETHPSSTNPGPQTIVIAPPPAAAQGSPRSPVYIIPGPYEPSYEPRFYPTTPAYYPSEYPSVKPVVGSPSHYGRSTTPPPPGYDSWSFVDDKFSTRRRRPHRPTDREATFSTPHPEAEDEGSHRRKRNGEAGRRRRWEESSSGRITFPRYGPPTTVIETSAGGETMFDSAQPSSPPPVIVVAPPQAPPGYDQRSNPSVLFSAMEDSIATVLLGFTADGDEFTPRLGNGRIRRPASWRRDYWPRGTVLSYIPGLIRRGFSSPTLNDTPVMRPRKLAGCISYHPPSSDKELGFEYDLRLDPSRLTHSTPTRTTPSLVFDSSELATVPPAEWMRLYHPALPWYIDVERDTSSAMGITVLEVLKQMHGQLMIPVMESDTWNEDMTKEVRKYVAQGLRRRAKKGPEGGLIFGTSGAVRLDFLGNEYIFEGLTKGKNGMWEIKTRDWRS